MPTDDSKNPAQWTAEPVFLEEIGRGYGGCVYRGLFRGEPCFIKVPQADLAESVHTRTSFEDEALQLARLQRVGMPRVVHLAQASERAYVVFSLPTGRVLPEWLQTRPSEQSVLEVASALCNAVCQLHALGYVHADLAPERVVIAGTHTVQLLDHGSVHRRVPFDPASDLHGLTALLRHLSCALAEPAAGAALSAIVDACHGSDRAPSDFLRAVHARLALLHAHPPIATGLGTDQLERAVRPSAAVRRELTQLQQRFHSGALGAVSVVVAPEGAGKSRLLADFSESVRARGVHVLAVRCTNSECAPFSTIQRLLENHLRDLEASDPSTRAHYESLLRTTAGSFGARLRLLSERLDCLFEPSSPFVAQGDARAAFIDGVADFLSRYLSALGRSVLVMD
ncbi:MAG TPA: AAA family ATPase, partial [Polyangiales bacterium]|nr:AAA family ATPase [Polyangiales bacterium]